MQCPHCAHPDSIRYGTNGVSNATVAQPADGSFKRYDEAKIPLSSSRPVHSISKGWGCEPSVGFSGFITRPSLAGLHFQSTRADSHPTRINSSQRVV